ncbi:unnamed protein product [Prorocentrum cordatum]|uniref:Uncharacterized protein n=1 Tax=Prorocentrum cordatum TaxID=2364126 RepID=A0ABN9RDV5_9DINO|nr:unnamed protein product [Polarella glacialis]
MLAPTAGSVLDAVAGTNARSGAIDFRGQATLAPAGARGRRPRSAGPRGDGARSPSRRPPRSASGSPSSASARVRPQAPSPSTLGRNGPRATSREPPAALAPNDVIDERLLKIHAHLREQSEHGDRMSVIGSRFRIRLTDVRACFVVTGVTTHDAWITTFPHSNTYFEGLDVAFTRQMLRSECNAFGHVITCRILSKGRAGNCVMVKFEAIRGALVASVGLKERHPEWNITYAARDAGPTANF